MHVKIRYNAFWRLFGGFFEELYKKLWEYITRL